MLSIDRPSAWALLATALLGAGTVAGAQQRPTPQEAQVVLDTRPDLVAQLRARLLSSGLTPDQVRARLRAQGYPEHMLDAYLTSGSRGGAAPPPSDSMLAAVAALGIQGEPLPPSARATPLRPDSAALARPADSTAVFGLSVFQGRTTAFDPNQAGPVDANYRLGPGDQLVLILTGDVEVAHTLDVTREGFVVVPQVGQLNAANLTLGQFESLLESRLDRVFGGVGRGSNAATRFSVSVGRLRTNQVFVVGDVAVPGSYQVSSAGTAMTALYAAGGPTANGSLRRVEVRRGGQTVDVLDVYDYLLRGDASHDVRLETGDVVFVPVHGARVQVFGEVVRPATYELRPGETLAELVHAAGGYTEAAAQQRVLVERILPPGQRAPDGRDRVVLDLGLASGAAAAGRLEAGDIVRVFPVTAVVRDRITVAGDVWAPGQQGFTAGMTLSQALTRAGGVRADAYLDDVLVTRLRPDSSRQQLRATLRDRSGAVVNDIALQENDEVRVFSVAEFRVAEYVTVNGAVRKAGRVPFRAGMTLRDVVLLAGGLTEGAYIDAAEVARLPEGGESRTTTAKTFRVALDSSYVVGSTTPGAPARRRTAPDVALRPHDQVLILSRPDWATPRSVVLAGEVKFPGRYTLASRAERLSDVVRRAGGLTDEAYSAGVAFYRTDRRRGRVGIDLPRVLADPRHRDNLILQDGDSLFIPQYEATVEVAGAVNSPVSVAYVPGADVSYYIRAAGGPSRRADVAHAYVTQPNGAVQSVERHRMRPDEVPVPRAGGAVYVPERDASDKPNYVAAFTAAAQVLGALVAIVAVVTR